MSSVVIPSGSAAFLVNGGEVGALMRMHDWSTSPLGAPEAWPQSLRSVVGLILSSKFPMFVAWGPDLGFLYNDAYAEILGAKHPVALGTRFHDVWAEIWPDISPLIDSALAGQSSYHEDLPLVVNRKGFDEQAWFTFSYSPVHDEAGRVAGMYCAVAETTGRVLAERHNASERERLARMFEQAPGFITILKSPEHIFEFVNATYRRLFGNRDFVGRPAREVFPELQGQGFYELLDQVYSTGERFVARSVPIRLEPSPGTPPKELFLDFIYEPVLDEAGQVTGIFCEGHDVTKAHRAEMALRTSEARLAEERSALATLVEHLPVGVILVDRDGQTLLHNSAYARIVPEATIPSRLPDAEERWIGYDAEGQRITRDGFAGARALRGEVVRNLEFLHRAPDGQETWTQVSGVPLRDTAGEIAGAVCVVVDIDAQKRAEERLQLATEAAELGIFDVDFTTGAMAWDARQRELWGIGPDEVITDEIFLAGIHPEDRGRVQAILAQAVDPEGGGLYAAEFRLVPREDGRERCIAATGRVHFEGRKPVRLIGTVQDFTTRKRTEAALRRSEARLRELNETLEQQVAERTSELDRVWRLSRDLLVVVRADGTVRAVNPALRTILGYEPDELIGRSFREFGGLEHVSRSQSTLNEVVSAEGLITFERRYRHKDGKLRWISWQTSVEGDLVYGYGRDITAEKERQAELEQAQEALRQSQKMDAMGQLTGGVAHDFNNLLTPIIASLDMLLRRGVGSERERRLMDGALQSAERAKVLVQRLLAFARRQPLQPTAVDVKELVSGMAELIASTSGPRIDVRVELPDDLPPAMADANQLEMAVLNLAVNARDAMPDAGVLTISAARESVRGRHPTKLRPGHYVRLSVKDTGEGMDEATLARAVEPFFSTKGVGKGTGLGLSMVHGLAAQLGGGLTIASRPGEGTTVELWLPISAVGAEEDEQAAYIVTAPQAQGTALLVDDEELVRMSTADMLMDLGYEVVEAQSAEEALRLLGEGLRPDLVVTDHLMPGLSGLDLARDLRSRRPDLPVLIVSGYAEMDGIAPGFARLTKPFRSSELAEKLAGLRPGGVA